MAGALIQHVDFKHVVGTEVDALANFDAAIEWLDCRRPILAKCSRSVMENAAIVVFCSKMIDEVERILVKLIFKSRLDVVPQNLDEVVAVCSTLLVKEAAICCIMRFRLIKIAWVVVGCQRSKVRTHPTACINS